MKKIIFLTFLMVTQVKAQTINNKIVIVGIVDSLNSKILQEKKTFWVSLPTSFYNPRFAKTRYPVVYVFDGDANFATVSAMLKQLSIRNGNMVFPEAIVVGIMNTHRTRDFTPTKSSYWIFNTPSPTTNSGGGEKFVSFLQQELIPYIDSIYPTTPYRTLIGHSLGGLAATNILINHTKLFNSYIIIDPSMWWDNQNFLKQAGEILHQKRFDSISLYLGIANNMTPGMDTIKLRNDTSRKTIHMRSIFKLKDLLQQNTANGLHFKYGYYADDTHMSSTLITEYDGFHFIFDFYSLPFGWEAKLFDPYDHFDAAQVFTTHFEQVSKKMGYKFLPPESLIDVFANTMADNYMPEKALSLYTLNVTDYPQSFGGYESLGDFYSDQKNVSKAIECYQKALKIKEVEEIRKKLNVLLPLK
jgi:uncharacterized protein